MDTGSGNKALAYGLIVNIYDPHSYVQERRQLQTQQRGDSSQGSLEDNTGSLIKALQNSNPHLRVVRRSRDTKVGGQRALSHYLSNDSPLGDRETNWLITLQSPEGLVFLVLTAPERFFSDYEPVFQQILNSLRLR